MKFNNVLFTVSIVLTSTNALPSGFFDVLKPIGQISKGITDEVGKVSDSIHDGISLILKGIPSKVPIQGIATWYGQESEGSCGKWHKNEDYIVAFSHKTPYNKFCGKKVKINYKGKSIIATGADTCESCHPPHIDLSRGAFAALTEGNYDLGEIKIEWHFIEEEIEEEEEKEKGKKKQDKDNDDLDKDNKKESVIPKPVTDKEDKVTKDASVKPQPVPDKQDKATKDENDKPQPVPNKEDKDTKDDTAVKPQPALNNTIANDKSKDAIKPQPAVIDTTIKDNKNQTVTPPPVTAPPTIGNSVKQPNNFIVNNFWQIFKTTLENIEKDDGKNVNPPS